MRTGPLVVMIDTGEVGEHPDPSAGRYLRCDDELGWCVRAFKTAWVRGFEGVPLEFEPLTASSTYGFSSEAVCSVKCGERSPNLTCDCGFYALETEAQTIAYSRELFAGLGVQPGASFDRVPVMLEVALSGRVGVFSGGFWGTMFRAERQEIRGYARPWNFTTAVEWQRRMEEQRGSVDGVSVAERVAAMMSVLRWSSPEDGSDGVGAIPFTPVRPQPGVGRKLVVTPDMTDVDAMRLAGATEFDRATYPERGEAPLPSRSAPD